MIIYTVISGILFGLFCSLMGIGLNLIFGVMRFVNLAHGDFLMLGAFGAYFAYSLYGISPIISVVIEIVVMIAIGAALYYAFVPRLLRSKDPEMLSLIFFFGMSQVIQALAVIFFSNNPRSIDWSALGTANFQVLGQSFQESWVVSALVSVIAIVMVYLYLYHTKLGYATRAVMGSLEEAASSGINVHRVSAWAMGIGFALAAAAGSLSPFLLGSITPNMGTDITTTSFSIIIIGSLGNPLGTVLGGLIYGLSSMFMQSYIPAWANLVPYLLLFVILLVKPSGLLGKVVRHA